MATDEALEVDIPGTEVTGPGKEQITQKVRYLCDWNNTSFPGSQPVSLSSANLREIFRNPYVACEKTDGVRFLFYAASNSVFLIDRKEIVRQLRNFHLPDPYDEDKRQQNTLLDGELVTDKIPLTDEEVAETVAKGESVIGDPQDPSKKYKRVVRFLIYDAIYVNRERVSELNLLERLKFAYQEVVQPRRAWEAKNAAAVGAERKNKAYLDIYVKDFFEIWDIAAIKTFWPRLPHLSDGIIFTPVKLPYVPGTCKELLKWKPPNLNTVDFYAEVHSDEKGPRGVRLGVGRRGVITFCGLWLAMAGEKCSELLQRHHRSADVSGRIWECFYDGNVKTYVPKRVPGETERFDFDQCTVHDGGWVVERIRWDKDTANDTRVVDKVMESISDNITLDRLAEEFARYRAQGKKAVCELSSLPSYYEEHGSRIGQSAPSEAASSGAVE